MRTIIDLPPEQLRALKGICSREGISRAEAVRRAVGAWVSAAEAPGRDRDVGFGLWRDRKTDARQTVDELRRDWDRP